MAFFKTKTNCRNQFHQHFLFGQKHEVFLEGEKKKKKAKKMTLQKQQRKKKKEGFPTDKKA